MERLARSMALDEQHYREWRCVKHAPMATIVCAATFFMVRAAAAWARLPPPLCLALWPGKGGATDELCWRRLLHAEDLGCLMPQVSMDGDMGPLLPGTCAEPLTTPSCKHSRAIQAAQQTGQ